MQIMDDLAQLESENALTPIINNTDKYYTPFDIKL
jgi:hypothetical protein